GLVDVPRRHVPAFDLGLDRAHPRPDFGVVGQRHRRHTLGAMADLALLLEDRRDVLGEGDRLGARLRLRRPGDQRNQARPEERARQLTTTSVTHDVCLSVTFYRAATEAWMYPLLQQQ